MPAYKSHHYVPQMYMRLFSGDDQKRVGVYVINRRKFVPGAPISGQLCRDYFYGKDSRAEKAFGPMEGHGARIFADVIEHRRLPDPGSQDHEWLIFYLGIQHSRTVGAADQHNESAEKLAKAMLRRKAELEGNAEILEALDLVRIRRTNAVSEVVGYATIAASLLADLRFVILRNESARPFVASDAPVVLHNRLYEDQHIGVTGFANVDLQIFLPLGPRLALFGFDDAAYRVRADNNGVLRVADATQVRLINDLQWEQASTVMLVSPEMSEADLHISASYWTERRNTERTVFREEIVDRSATEVRTRIGSGPRPSGIALDLSFVEPILPKPSPLGLYDIPPFRDAERVDRVHRAFETLDKWGTLRG